MTDARTLSPDLVRRAGVALYGEHWQAPLARALVVDERTMRRVAQAEREGRPYDINPAWAPKIAKLLSKIPLEREIQARFAREVLELLGQVEERAADDPRERMRRTSFQP